MNLSKLPYLELSPLNLNYRYNGFGLPDSRESLSPSCSGSQDSPHLDLSSPLGSTEED